MRLLLVEDHVSLADELTASLTRQGYAVDWLADGRDAAYQGASEPYDLIILDLGLPGKPGLEVLQEWRAGGLATPVLVLTARGSWAERIEGLKAGADDYLTKPFHLAELNARIQSLLRRKRFNGSNEIVLDDIRVNTTTSQVWAQNQEVVLTKKEYELLLYFISNRNRILNKESIAEHLWGDNIDMADSFDFIYTHIKNLRKKVLLKGSRNQIRSLYGMGYKFVTE